MTALIFDGKKIAAVWSAEIKEKLEQSIMLGRKVPHLAVIFIGTDAASTLYIKNKQQACEKIGMRCTVFHYPEHISEKELTQEIVNLNNNQDISAILIQLPLPKTLSKNKILSIINPQKDVDGLHPTVIINMASNKPVKFYPCTPLGIMHLLQHAKIFTQLKKLAIKNNNINITIVGDSNLVGKPLYYMLLKKLQKIKIVSNLCNITVCNIDTTKKNLEIAVKQADLLIVAVGKINLIPGDWVKINSTVIDVGTNYINNKIMGDVEFEKAVQRAACITPVPGGVGPMTVVALLKNLLKSTIVN